MWEEIRHALAEIVGAAPDRAYGAQARGVEELQGVEIRVDGLGAFEMDDGCECSVAQASTNVGYGFDDSELVV